MRFLEIAKCLNFKSTATDFEINGFSIDTRTLKKGNCFIALKGANFDANNFLETAYKNGASLIIAEKNLKLSIPVIVVESSYKALVEIAKYNRKKLSSSATFIGITGSVGKTSTKEILAQLLKILGKKVHFTTGNLNNEIGLPLNLANMKKGVEFGIFEMGMRGFGQIEYLTNILKPNISIITAVAPVHLEFFKSVEEIALAKAEILKGLNESGTCFLPKENEYFPILLNEAKKLNIKNIIPFSEKDFDININQGAYFINKSNVAVCLHVIKHLNLDYKKLMPSIDKLKLEKARGNIIKLKNNITVINDAYNASPVSVKFALDNIKTLEGKKLAVLGDMKELGADEIQYHKQVIEQIQNLDFAIIHGEIYKKAYVNQVKNITYINNLKDIFNVLNEYISKHKNEKINVLFKGSNSTLIHKIADEFIACNLA